MAKVPPIKSPCGQIFLWLNRKGGEIGRVMKFPCGQISSDQISSDQISSDQISSDQIGSTAWNSGGQQP